MLNSLIFTCTIESISTVSKVTSTCKGASCICTSCACMTNSCIGAFIFIYVNIIIRLICQRRSKLSKSCLIMCTLSGKESYPLMPCATAHSLKLKKTLKFPTITIFTISSITFFTLTHVRTNCIRTNCCSFMTVICSLITFINI